MQGQHASKRAIKSITLSSAGRVLYETDNVFESLLLGSTDDYNDSKLVTFPFYHEDANVMTDGRGDNQFYVIPFGNSACDTSKIAGCCAFKNLNSVLLEVVPNDDAGEINHPYIVTAYVRYYQAIATSAQSGRISISLSS